jgi:hypothetical protein
MAANRDWYRNRKNNRGVEKPFNTLSIQEIEMLYPDVDRAFNQEYEKITTGFVSLMDNLFIDTMIEHYIDFEEYEKCGVLKNIKDNYGKDTENK